MAIAFVMFVLLLLGLGLALLGEAWLWWKKRG